MSFKDKITLVTGSSCGIGRAIVKTLISRDSIVIGTTTGHNKNNALLDNNLDKTVNVMILNVKDIKSINNLLKEIKLKFGDIDILINNAGIIRDNLLIRMKNDEWQDVLDINLSSVFYLSKAVLPAMIKKKFGRIINISSVIGIMGNCGQVNYAAAKAGLIGFSKSLAREVASRGITVNTVAPGFINTNMTRNLHEYQRANILSKIPIGRFGKAQEIANVVAFLASHEASYITGETIHVNGGMYMI